MFRLQGVQAESISTTRKFSQLILFQSPGKRTYLFETMRRFNAEAELQLCNKVEQLQNGGV